jgi:8-oxo-dGTP pyrophosphatase MutT (NUDIX family)
MDYQVFTEPPVNFVPKMVVVGCMVECDGRLLFLKRSSKSHQGGTFSIPAGKLDAGETHLQTAKRELFEETGIQLEESALIYSGALYQSIPFMDYVFHLYRTEFERFPKVSLNHEHSDFVWVTADEALLLPLIAGGREALYYHNLWKESN